MILNKTYIEKLLTDAGYDIHTLFGDWIIGESSYYQKKVALFYKDDVIILALPTKIAISLNKYENANFIPISEAPEGFTMGMGVEISELLPWLKKSSHLVIETIPDDMEIDIESLVKQRRGQERLRIELMKYWDGKCAVTGISTKELLITSHIKPWSECSSSHEKLDPFNALLLNVAIDKAFDKGLISFDNSGKILISPYWNKKEANILGINENMILRKIDPKHIYYLEFHRNNIFKK